LPLPPPCQTIDNLTGFDIRKLYELATVTSLLLHALFVWVLVLATRAVSHTEWWCVGTTCARVQPMLAAAPCDSLECALDGPPCEPLLVSVCPCADAEVALCLPSMNPTSTPTYPDLHASPLLFEPPGCGTGA
jgi:hypothetical protein